MSVLGTDLLLQSHSLIQKKIQDKGWDVKPEVVTQWLQKLQRYVSHYKNLAVIRWQLEEIIHYLTLNQLQQLKIPSNGEHDCVVNHFRQLGPLQSSSRTEQSLQTRLQAPEETFGEKIETAPCGKCGGTNVTSLAIQTRSADEPTSYYYQCRDCNARWKLS